MAERVRGECTYRLRVTEDTWECLLCENEYVFVEGGPKENEMLYCPKCGAKIVRLEYSEWDWEKDEVVIRGEDYGTDQTGRENDKGSAEELQGADGSSGSDAEESHEGKDG